MERTWAQAYHASQEPAWVEEAEALGMMGSQENQVLGVTKPCSVLWKKRPMT